MWRPPENYKAPARIESGHARRRLTNMEVCVDNVQSAITAETAGATQVELCANLIEGGTTPSIGMLKTIKKNIKIPVFVMLRPRAGDFLYSEEEFQVIKEDLICLKESGADGFALGILTADGEVDQRRCKELIEQCSPLPVTFHRAFDMTKSPLQSLEVIIQLGCKRVLTSGCDTSVLEGLPLIVDLVQQAGDRISVVPAGGITERNISRVMIGLGRPQAVFHCSGRTTLQSGMIHRNTTVSMGSGSGSEYTVKVACAQQLQTILTNAITAVRKIK